MSAYTIRKLDDVPDAFEGKYPGEMRFFTGPLEAEQVAFTHRTMPPGAGGKGSYGHRHHTQEEIYFVISGTLQFKLEDEVVDVPGGSAVRVAPSSVELLSSATNSSPPRRATMSPARNVACIRSAVPRSTLSPWS